MPDISAMSNEGGEFAFDGLPAGAYLLRALGPAQETGETRITVLEGEVAHPDIVVSAS